MSNNTTAIVAFFFGIGVSFTLLKKKYNNDDDNKKKKKKIDVSKDKLPTLFRRTTLLVSDMEKSLAIYRDILGLEIVFDKTLPITGNGLPTGIFDAKARLIFLKSYTDHMVGVIGLLCYLDKPLVKPMEAKRKLGLGDCVILLNTTNVKERMEKLKAQQLIHVVSEGSIDTYPTANGGQVTVWGNSFFDLDGNFIELNEVKEGSV